MQTEQQHDQLELAQEFLLACPFWHLLLLTVLAVTAVVGAAGADFYTVWLFMRQSFTDVTGNATTSGMVVASVAVITLALYWLAAYEWDHDRLRLGWLFYAGAVALLTFAMWDWDQDWAAKAWASVHPGGGNVLTDDAAAGPPGWFTAPFNIALGFLFSACGLLFIRFKHTLAERLEEWKIHHAARGKLHQAKLVAEADNDVAYLINQLAYVENKFHSIGFLAVRQAEGLEAASVASRRDALLQKSRNVLTSRAEKATAKADAEKLTAWLEALNRDIDDETGAPAVPVKPTNDGKPKKGNGVGLMCLLLAAGGVLLSTRPARAQSMAELCAAAPSLQVLIDVSGSSPLLSPGYGQAVASLLEAKINALPICGELLIVTVGDATAMPLMLRKRVYVRTAPGGATKADLCRGLRQLLAAMPQRIAANPQGKSELIGAFADAARNINPQAKGQSSIVMLSDGIENSPLANCDRNPHCHFPAPSFKLQRVAVSLLGCGLGVRSDRAAWITRNWDLFFTAAGVKADLRRSF